MKKPVSLNKKIGRQLSLNLFFGAGILFILIMSGLAFIEMTHFQKNIKDLLVSVANMQRSRILEGDIRNSEIKVGQVLGIGPFESLKILDEKFKPIYSEVDKQGLNLCVDQQACWDIKTGRFNAIQPIYFDENSKGIFGYLYLSKKFQFNWFGFFWTLVLFALFSFVLYFFLKRQIEVDLNQIFSSIQRWGQRIEYDPRSIIIQDSEIPFSELKTFASSLKTLNERISYLEEDAKNEARLLLLRGVAHDLLTPLSQIEKYLYLIKMNSHDSNRVLVTSAMDSLQRLKNISLQIRDLKNTSQIIPTRVESLNQIVQKIEKKLISEIDWDKKNVTLKVFYSDNILLQISEYCLERILFNLVKNAFDASPEGSEVHVKVLTEAGKAVVKVVDAGRGIPEQNLEVIFQSDFTTKKGNGTGLGLSVVKQMAEQMNAKILVHSILGKGSIFSLVFEQPIYILNEGIHEL